LGVEVGLIVKLGVCVGLAVIEGVTVVVVVTVLVDVNDGVNAVWLGVAVGVTEGVPVSVSV
jgi:hypothetical protein